MPRETRRRWTAWLLSVAMTLSLVSDALPAFAQTGAPSAEADPAPVVTPEPVDDFSSGDTGRPRLYVNFLGDNRTYLAKGSTQTSNGLAVPSGEDWSHKTNPTPTQGGTTTWVGYNNSDADASTDGDRTIFWVGVGVDRLNIFDLFRQDPDSGVYSLELGFYYNSQYIEPYTGSDYLATLRDANIHNTSYPNQWPAGYQIVKAEAGVEVQSDAVTRENITDPSMADIQAGAATDTAEGWKMTYVSLEKGSAATEARFANDYDGTFHAAPAVGSAGSGTTEEGGTTEGGGTTGTGGTAEEGGGTGTTGETGASLLAETGGEEPADPGAGEGETPAAPAGEEDMGTQYLLMIPFVLKDYDPNGKLCLRLVRDASHFSVGGGADGAAPYAAWERTTTRNPGRELKLMTNFQGDLNIWTGDAISDSDYQGILKVENAGSIENKAQLYVQDDPTLAPVAKVTYNMSRDENGQIIAEGSHATKTLKGLSEGLGMATDVTVGSGYTATVSIYYEEGEGTEKIQVPIPYTTTQEGLTTHYYFVIPEVANQVFHVDVKFALNGATEFWLVLREDRTAVEPVVEDAPMDSNATSLVATQEDNTEITIDKTTSPGEGYPDSPSKKVKKDSKLEIVTTVHRDYEAVVSIHYGISEETGTMTPPNSYTGEGITIADDHTITIPSGGTLVINKTPESDVIVNVKYQPATRYKAHLEVWHADGAPVLEMNVAQMETTVYTDADEAMEAYTAVVYHDDKSDTGNSNDIHNAVEKPDFRVLNKTDASSASQSGALGGDGRAPAVWAPADTSDKNNSESMMALVYAVANNIRSDFTGRIAAGDLRALTVSAAGDGLRKNETGEFFTDSEMGTFYVILKELGKQIKDSTELTTAYKKTVTEPDPEDSTKTKELYSYYELTPAQVQMFVLDYFAHEADKDHALTVMTDTAAETAVKALSWYDPAEEHQPPTHPDMTNDGNNTGNVGQTWLNVRGGRTVEVIAQAQSDYEVESVKVYKVDELGNIDTAVDPIDALRDPDYQNVYTFDMPEYESVVRVTYALRGFHPVELAITRPDDTDSETAAKLDTTVTAYQRQENASAAKQVTWNESKIQKDILDGSAVSVRVRRIQGYTASVTVTRQDTGDPVATTPSLTNPLSDLETVFSFPMPSTWSTTGEAGSKEQVRVSVTYLKNETPHKAVLEPMMYDGGSISSDFKAVWEDTNPASAEKSNVYSGTNLQGNLTAAPGYHICAVRAYTKDDAGAEGVNVPFLLSGNGWNNGKGGAETVKVTMPNQDLFVRVIFKEGPPAEEPALNLTLRVEDPENTGTPPAEEGGTITYDANWAKAEIKTPKAGGGAITLGEVGKNAAHGNEVMAQTAYATAGDLVELTFDKAEDYYVKSITVSPEGLSVPVTRTSDTTAQFYMPAGSAAVTVAFAKKVDGKDPTKYRVTFHKTENGTEQTDNTSARGNRLVRFTSPTLQSILTETGQDGYHTIGDTLPATEPSAGDSNTNAAAKPGETVTVELAVEGGWYLDAVTVTGGGGKIPCAIADKAGGGLQAKFIMPFGDVQFTAHYREGTKPSQRESYELELVVSDPENLGPTTFVDNNAKADITGSSAGTIGPLGKAQSALRGIAFAKPGDTVTVTYAAGADFALDLLQITANGTEIVPTYLPGGKAQFTMPAADVTAQVRFRKGEAREYTANLVLRFPAGTAVEDYDKIGLGTFSPEGSLDHWNDPDPTKDNRLYSRIASVGEGVGLDLLAQDGYYISKVTITPANLGVPVEVTGAVARQSGQFTMPAADVTVNVYFEKGWPDEVPYDVKLVVADGDGTGSTANFEKIDGAALTDDQKAPIPVAVDKGTAGAWSKTVSGVAHDRDEVRVALTPAAGSYVQSVTVTDSRGDTLPWRYVPGGVAFDMSPAHVTVTVRFAKGEVPDEMKHDVTLHVTTFVSSDEASLTAGTTTVTGAVGDDTIQNVPAGTTLTLAAAPTADQSLVAAVYAVDANGKHILLPANPNPPVTEGGSVELAMPDSDADVYVTFADAKEKGPEDLVGTLIVAGPSPVGTSGSAVMKVTDNAAKTTGTVDASGVGTLFAPAESALTVELSPNPGYAVTAVRVTNPTNGSDLPYTWAADQKSFTAEMSPPGIQVYVEYAEADPDKLLTAQIVVNDATVDARTPTGNKAVLKKSIDPDVADPGARIYTDMKTGQNLYVDVTVAPGYKVEYIKVVPARLGVAPSLLADDIASQTASFVMPGEDVVVYVKFAKDSRTRYDAILVTGWAADVSSADLPDNWATIHSDYSGASPKAQPQGPTTQSVKAAAADADGVAEWVTVDYSWADGYSISSITVKDAAGNDVPFTQEPNDNENRAGKLRFPMIASNVTVTILYKDDPTPPTYNAVLHVIDLDATEGEPPTPNAASWGQLTWKDSAGTVQAQTSRVGAAIGPVGGTETLKVPGGETVTVDADAVNANSYLQAGYVLYRATGQMIHFNFPVKDTPDVGFIDPATGTFTMHPASDVDVYLYYTQTPPTETRHAAVLMLDSDAGDTGEKASTATIQSGAMATGGIEPEKVTANVTPPDHAYITAVKDDQITIQVNPATGYIIESILFTPLGIEKSQGTGNTAFEGKQIEYTQSNNTITFSMPDENVAVRVKLAKSSTTPYNLTIHYGWQSANADGAAEDWADLTYTLGVGKYRLLANEGKEQDSAQVPEKTKVTLGVSLDAPDLVLSAYALQDNGALVPLSKNLEGTGEGDSYGHPDKWDDSATFEMPSGDVHVFVWFTDTKPDIEDWHTAVLVVTDEKKSGETTILNSGKNTSTIESSTNNTTATTVKSWGVWSDNEGAAAPYHATLIVGKGETVTVRPQQAAAGYAISTVTLSNAPASTTPALGNQNNYDPRTYTVGDVNTAVRVHYVGSGSTKSDLTVILRDPDNPGNRTVTNSAQVSPKDMTALDVKSTTSAGARQVIREVKEGTTVPFTVRAKEGYTPVATWTANGKTQRVALTKGDTADAGGYYTYTGTQQTMPDSAATLEIVYRTDGSTGGGTPVDHLYDLTMTWVGEGEGDSATADDGLGRTIEADGAKLTDLLGTETITYTAAAGTGRRVAGVVLSCNGTSEILPIPAAGGSTFQMPTADAELTIIFEAQPDPDDPTPTTESYIAAVKAVDLPAGCAAPTIAVTPTANPVTGHEWTAAKKDETITVTVQVPEGYKATLTADNGIFSPSVELTTGDNQTATFPMPAANVTVIVTYVKTAFTATLRILGAAADDTATMTHDATTVTATEAAPTATISGLTGGETIDFTADAAPGRKVTAVYLTDDAGKVTYQTLTNGAGSFLMPAADATLTVVFRDAGVAVNQYMASVVTAGTDGKPENAASIANLSQDFLPHGDSWTYGEYRFAPDKGDTIRVSYTAAPGYTVVVTAVQIDPSTGAETNFGALVHQVPTGGLPGGAGTAEFHMPAADVVVKVVYYGPGDTPPETKNDLRLRIVGHDGLAENKAALTVLPGGTVALAVQGDTKPDKTPVLSDPVTVPQGAELLVSADRRSDYRIVDVTVTVGAKIELDGTLTGGVETHFDWNDYLLNATTVLTMPGQEAVVTVYFQRAYQATLTIYDRGPNDTVTMKDNRDNFQSVDHTLPADDRVLTGLQGGENIITTPSSTNTNRKITVIQNTHSGGAQVIELDETPIDPNDHTFRMPEEDVNVSVLFQDNAPDPDDLKYYVTVQTVGEGSGVGDNAATVEDLDKVLPPAPTVTTWTQAMMGDQVRLNITLEKGYQARVTSITKDAGTGTVYISRILFTEKTEDMTALLTMPAANVHIVVEFIKGYSATLKVTDKTATVGNEGRINVALPATVTGVSAVDGTVTYNYTGSEANKGGDDTITGLSGGAAVGYTATPQDPDFQTKIVRSSASGGTLPLAAPSGSFQLDREDVTVEMIYKPANAEDDQLAKVALAGFSDVVGNGVYADGSPIPTIVDQTNPDPSTTTGNIWTTTQDTHTVKVTLTVAEGYVATVETTYDSDVGTEHKAGDKISMTSGENANKETLTFTYEEHSATPHIGAEETLTFTMPADTDVTVTITYTKLSAVPRPYDPELVNDPADRYENGWIRVENRGDYAVVTVPTLADESGSSVKLSSVNKDRHQFRFHMVEDTSGAPEGWTYEDLGDLIALSYPDPDYTGTEPYLTDNFYTDDKGNTDPTDDIQYTGARFFLIVLTDEEIKAAVDADTTIDEADKETKTQERQRLAQKLRDILDNRGTDKALTENTRLFITTWDTALGEGSDYTDVEVPRYYELTGYVESYAPQHPFYVSLYDLKEETDADLTKAEGYEEEARIMARVVREDGENLWVQKFSVKSSELFGKLDINSQIPTDAPIYRFEIAKASHIVYEHLNLTLGTAVLDTPTDPDCRTVTVKNVIQLIAGDLDGDGLVRLNDRSLLMTYLGGRLTWNQETDPEASRYAYSVYNPRSLAYWADLTGDGMITIADLAVIMDKRNYNKSYANNTPFALANEASGAMEISLFSLFALEEEHADLPPQSDLLEVEDLPSQAELDDLEEEIRARLEAAQAQADLIEQAQAELMTPEEVLAPDGLPEPAEPDTIIADEDWDNTWSEDDWAGDEPQSAGDVEEDHQVDWSPEGFVDPLGQYPFPELLSEEELLELLAQLFPPQEPLPEELPPEELLPGELLPGETPAPEQPIDPTQPPEGGQPGEPENPEETGKPVDPDGPTGQDPGESGQPTDPPSQESDKPMEGERPDDPDKPVAPPAGESGKPMEGERPGDLDGPADPDPGEGEKPPAPEETADPDSPLENVEPTGPSMEPKDDPMTPENGGTTPETGESGPGILPEAPPLEPVLPPATPLPEPSDPPPEPTETVIGDGTNTGETQQEMEENREIGNISEALLALAFLPVTRSESPTPPTPDRALPPAPDPVPTRKKEESEE